MLCRVLWKGILREMYQSTTELPRVLTRGSWWPLDVLAVVHDKSGVVEKPPKLQERRLGKLCALQELDPGEATPAAVARCWGREKLPMQQESAEQAQQNQEGKTPSSCVSLQCSLFTKLKTLPAGKGKIFNRP